MAIDTSRSAPLQTACQQGFSLLEMAIVLAILGVLMGGVLVAVSQSVENGRRASARAQLQQIEEALYAYAQIKGHLPAPVEISGISYVPSSELGLGGATNEAGLLLDPWRNPLRYEVMGSYTTEAGLETEYMDGPTGLKICQETTCDTVLSNIAPAVVLSMGANWSLTASTSASEDEKRNAGLSTGSAAFVFRDYSEEQFDDQLVWLSPYILFSRMISAGKLP